MDALADRRSPPDAHAPDAYAPSEGAALARPRPGRGSRARPAPDEGVASPEAGREARGRGECSAEARPTYAETRDRLATYFDRTASAAWERLTSDAPVSRIRRTVRAGRAEMRAALLARLPRDLSGVRVLDAGCGPGDMAVELARRGARVTGVDLSGSLLEVARRRTPADLAGRIVYRQGDMTADLGRHDVTIAMDSLIHYGAADIADALARLAPRTGLALFTVAPRTPLLATMHAAGRLLPKGDRAPRIVPHADRALVRALAGHGLSAAPVARIQRGFYVSQAWEMRP